MLIKKLYIGIITKAIVSAAMLLTSLNQITRLGFIIKVFIKSSLLFIILDNKFLGLTYIIVYVGAIAILFLFVIKMVTSSPLRLQVNSDLVTTHQGVTIRTNQFKQFLWIFKVFMTVLSLALISNSPDQYGGVIFEYFNTSKCNIFRNPTDIQILANYLFLGYPICLILIGITLWIILIGILIISSN